MSEPSDKKKLLFDLHGRLGGVGFGVARVAPDPAYWLVRSGAGLCGTQNILAGFLDALIEPHRSSAPSLCLNGPVREACFLGDRQSGEVVRTDVVLIADLGEADL